MSCTTLLHRHKYVEAIQEQHAISNRSVLGARKKLVNILQIKWQENFFSPGTSVVVIWRYIKESSTDRTYRCIWSRLCFTSYRIRQFASLLSWLSKRLYINVQHTRLTILALPLWEAFVSHAQTQMRISLGRLSLNHPLHGKQLTLVHHNPFLLFHYHTFEYTVDMNCPKTEMRKTIFKQSFAFRYCTYTVCAYFIIFCSFRSQ